MNKRTIVDPTKSFLNSYKVRVQNKSEKTSKLRCGESNSIEMTSTVVFALNKAWVEPSHIESSR